MSIKTTAKTANLVFGEYFTDPMGHTHVSKGYTEYPNELGVYVYIQGQNHPEFYLNDDVLTIDRRVVDEKPYKVYTRDYDANGDCDKRVFSFKTRAGQMGFANSTTRCVTFTN